MKLEVVCINDSNRPNEIPITKWVKKGEPYTVINIIKCNVQGGLLGFELAEIELVGCDPYYYFSSERFAPPVELTEDEVENMVETELETV